MFYYAVFLTCPEHVRVYIAIYTLLVFRYGYHSDSSVFVHARSVGRSGVGVGLTNEFAIKKALPPHAAYMNSQRNATATVFN